MAQSGPVQSTWRLFWLDMLKKDYRLLVSMDVMFKILTIKKFQRMSRKKSYALQGQPLQWLV